MFRSKQAIHAFIRIVIALVCVVPAVARSAEPGVDGSVPPTLRPVPPDVLANCYPKSTPRTATEERVLVVATISAEGKADNLRLPPGIGPWQEETVRCAIALLHFEPAMRDGVPVTTDVSVPLILKPPATATVIPPRLAGYDAKKLTGCYARSARRAGAEGQVEINLTVEPDGRVSKYELPHGIEPWQKVTAECVMDRLRFQPATRDGVPFTAELRFPLNFSLEGSVPLTLAKLAAPEAEMEAAIRQCYSAGVQGTGSPEYRVTVNVRGWPSQVVLVRSTGDKSLDSAGSCVIKKLRFIPAKRGEQPVMSTLLVPIALRPLEQ